MFNAIKSGEFILRWEAFVKERFPFSSYFPLILFYFTGNAFIAVNVTGQTIKGKNIEEILGFIVIFLIFFHLRIFDDIKDSRNDRNAHPDRPLARGLISAPEAKLAAAGLISAEIIIASLIGLPAFFAVCCTAVYSLIMYKEFFIGKWLRPRLATYALSHTLVSCLMSLFIFSAVTGNQFWRIPKEYGIFVLSNWLIFNIFEFGRKTFGKEEESDLIDSYSKRLGPLRSALNIILMAILAICIAFYFGRIFELGKIVFIPMIILLLSVFAPALLYARFNNIFYARWFRGTCSVFILLYNVVITSGFLFKR